MKNCTTHLFQPFIGKHQYSYSPYCTLYKYYGADKENLSNNQEFFSWWLFPLFSWENCVIQWWYCKEKIDASHS